MSIVALTFVYGESPRVDKRDLRDHEARVIAVLDFPPDDLFKNPVVELDDRHEFPASSENPVTMPCDPLHICWSKSMFATHTTVPIFNLKIWEKFEVVNGVKFVVPLFGREIFALHYGFIGYERVQIRMSLRPSFGELEHGLLSTQFE
jgi:hypothetical protein